MHCDGDKTSNSVWSFVWFTVILPLVPPAAGIPAETREARCLKHEVIVDTAALNYLPPTNQIPHACYCPPITWQDFKHTYCTNLLLHVLRVRYRELYIYMTRTVSHCFCGFHVFWLLRVDTALTCAMREAVNPAVVHKPHRNIENSSEICVQGEWGGGLPMEVNVVVFFSPSLHISMWIEFSCSSEVPQILFEFIKQHECLGHVSCLWEKTETF